MIFFSSATLKRFNNQYQNDDKNYIFVEDYQNDDQNADVADFQLSPDCPLAGDPPGKEPSLAFPQLLTWVYNDYDDGCDVQSDVDGHY